MRRCLLLSLLLPLAAACASHDAAGAVAHASGHRDVVIRVDQGAGVGTLEMFFTSPPVLLVTGDGTTYLRMEEATTTGIVWPLATWHTSEPDLQVLLRQASDDGLLAPPPDYTTPEPVADAGDSSVDLAAGGGTWRHRANAVGAFDHDTAARTRLADFVETVERWAREPGRAGVSPLRPQTLRVMATPLAAGAGAGAPTGRWPRAARVDLADIGGCRVVRDTAVVRALTTREARSYRQAGTTYSVSAAVLLPGDSCARWRSS
jgi:hypothetical protein